MKVIMKLRPVDACHFFFAHLCLMARTLIATNVDSEKKFATAMACDVPISPLIPHEEW
jgi:hypothetical protein